VPTKPARAITAANLAKVVFLDFIMSQFLVKWIAKFCVSSVSSVNFPYDLRSCEETSIA
jgi:hypothetical protein